MTESVATQEKIKVKVVAEFMLSDILSNLEDIERADSGIQAFLCLIATSKTLKNMFLSFLQKCRKNKTSLKNCSPFTKRILLFCLAHYAFLGDITDYELRFMKDKVPPLEALLVRLDDINVAFGEEIRKESSLSGRFYEVSLHTVKQHVLMLLKKSQYSNAEKFVLKQKFIKSNHRLVLENMIKHCVMKEGLLEKIIRMKDHSYLGYYISVARFIHSLNQLLDETFLKNFGETYKEALTESDYFSDNNKVDRSKHGFTELNGDGNDTEHETPEYTMDRLSSSAKSSIDENSVEDESESVLSPKISLSYRLKKSQSGIIIPCKYIVQHCRKAASEDDVAGNEGIFRMPANPVKKTANPNQARAAVPRRAVLGDRFETSSAAHFTRDRSYSCKKKTVFTLEIDSYIAEGCFKFGVGNWTRILKSFPFPPDYTNTKIKDRFRVLVKKNFIAVLNDGDISVLDKALKAKLATARQNISQLKRQDPQGYAKGSSESSSHNISQRNLSRSPRKRTISPVVENTSSADDNSTGEVSKHFILLEDAYLVCGAMHLGLRWDAIMEYMDFRNHITVDDMQKRWETLVDKKAVKIIDGAVECKDKELRQKCQEVAKQLKDKILTRRKMYHKTQSPEESVISEEDLVIKRKRREQAIVESEDESEKASQPPASSPTKSTQLNQSIDAGTQTSKPKFQLGNRSPSTLEASSSGSGNTSEQSSIQLTDGSPIRPSMINLFKSKKSPRKDKASPRSKEIRQKRQRELARIQRRDQTVQKRQWTDAETTTFLEMLSKHGPGKWSKMLDDGYDVLKERTPVMLKDKYRNLLQKGVLPSDVMKKWEIGRVDRT